MAQGFTKFNITNTDYIAEGSSNLYYTDARVSANSDVSSNTSHRNTTSGNPHEVSKSDVGLGSVVNSDTTTTANITDSIDKRFLTDAQESKVDAIVTDGDGSQYLANDGTYKTISGGGDSGINFSFAYLTKQFLYASDKKELTVKAGTKIRFETDVDVRYYEVETDTTIDVEASLDTGATLDNGKDYYVYLVKDGSGGAEIEISLNSTYPDGDAADTSRKIGGFHTLCADVGTISGHTLSGYSEDDILPQSVWCLAHRPVASPEGMVYIPEIDSWVDIYLQSGTYNVSTDTLTTASEYGATVTDDRAWADHQEDLWRVDKRMLSDTEFSVMAEGSNQKTNISGSAEPSPKTAGGHVDTASRRMISNYGVEECCGFLWQWINESGPSGGSGWSNYDGLSGDKGQVYGSIYATVAGGNWGPGTSCGSRCRSGFSPRSTASANYGCRGASWTKAV